MPNVRLAELTEKGMRTYAEVYTKFVRLAFENAKKEGRLPGTIRPTPEEEFRDLTAELPFLQEIIQKPATSPEDIEDFINANAKLIRWQELQEQLGGGTE